MLGEVGYAGEWQVARGRGGSEAGMNERRRDKGRKKKEKDRGSRTKFRSSWVASAQTLSKTKAHFCQCSTRQQHAKHESKND